ncbi:MAG: response regulator [Myxococcota bacterium]
MRRVDSSAPLPLVLYVEDDPTNWEVTELRLRPRFRMLWARTDLEACALARQHAKELHAVLMDIQLQGSTLDGIALTRLLRGKPVEPLPDYARQLPRLECPIFFVTAFGTLHDPEALREAGGDSHVPKPVDFVKLSLLLAQANMRRALMTLSGS